MLNLDGGQHENSQQQRNLPKKKARSKGRVYYLNEKWALLSRSTVAAVTTVVSQMHNESLWGKRSEWKKKVLAPKKNYYI